MKVNRIILSVPASSSSYDLIKCLKGCAVLLSGFALIVIAIFSAVILLDILVVNKISPWHDELWNLYASFEFYGIRNGIWHGCSQAMCISLLGFEVPILSGPYHGVVKSLIFSPFVLLGDITLIRLMNVLLYLVPLWYILRERNTFGIGGVYLIGSAYYLLFPALFFEAVFDQGQFIVSNLLLVIAALELVKDLRFHHPYRLVFVIVLSSLAVYEKLTNFPVAFALSIVAFIVILQNREFRHALISFACIVFALPYVAYLWNHMPEFVGMTDAPELGYITNLKIIISTIYTYLFQKSFTMSQITGGSVSGPIPVIGVILTATTMVLSVVLCVRLKEKPRAVHFLTILSPVIAMILFPFFNGLSRPWHIYQVAPLVVIPYGYFALNAKSSADSNQNNVFILRFMVLIFALVSVVSMSTKAINKPRIHPQDASLIEVASSIKKYHHSKNLVCLDYSVCYNLLFILGSDYKLLAEWAFSPKDNICRNLNNIKDADYYLVTHYNKSSEDEFLYGRSKYFSNNCAESYSDKKINTRPGIESGYKVYMHAPDLL